MRDFRSADAEKSLDHDEIIAQTRPAHAHANSNRAGKENNQKINNNGSFDTDFPFATQKVNYQWASCEVEFVNGGKGKLKRDAIFTLSNRSLGRKGIINKVL